MRLLHERDRDILKRGANHPAADRKPGGFLAFLDQARSGA
jgi:hypothetical protein